MSKDLKNADPFETTDTNVSSVKKETNESESLVDYAKKIAKNPYPYSLRNGEICKMKGQGDNKVFDPVIYGDIVDYKVQRQYGDYGATIHQIKLLSNNKIYFFEGYGVEEMRDWIYGQQFGRDKKSILNFLNATIGILRADISEYGIIGGYNRIEDIQKPSKKEPAKYLEKWLRENFGGEQLRLLKSLILLPFHKILREDETAQPRGLVRGIFAPGDSDCLKTFTTNFALNCFVTHSNIPLHDNRSSDTIPALRNDCHNNTGILLCDEADKLIVDWTGGGKLKPEAINFFKRIEQSRSLNVADLNNQGTNMGSKINSTPVCLWNGFIDYIDATLRDRILYCPFNKENKPEIKELWSLKKGKRQMLTFGEHIASAFKENYNDIKVSDTETATNIIIDYLMEAYGYNLDFLKETPLMYIDGLQDEATIRDNILGALRSYVREPELIDNGLVGNRRVIKESWVSELQKNNKFRNHLTYSNEKLLRIKCKSFTDWVNKMVLKGGELSKEEIASILDWKISLYANVKVFEVESEKLDEMLSLKEKD